MERGMSCSALELTGKRRGGRPVHALGVPVFRGVAGRETVNEFCTAWVFQVSSLLDPTMVSP